MIMIADLIDPDDERGRSYREINNSRKHKFEVGSLVEIDGVIRLFVAKHTRDCDGTPLYNLTPYLGIKENTSQNVYGYSEDSLKGIDP